MITTLIEQVIKKYTKEDLPELKENLSTNLEFRLIFPVDLSKPFKIAKKDFIKNYLNDLLTLSLGNITIAAKKAHLHRRHLHRIINEFEIDPSAHRKELLKPAQYLKKNVHNIIELSLSNFIQDDNIKAVYSNLEDISEIIAANMDEVSYDEAIELFEKEYIEKVLKNTNYNITKTAETMDISERTLYRKISKLNIAVT